MVTTNCQEIAGVNCSVPLSGNTVEELKKNVFAHAQKDHKDMLAKMSPADQAQVTRHDRSHIQEKIRWGASSLSL